MFASVTVLFGSMTVSVQANTAPPSTTAARAMALLVPMFICLIPRIGVVSMVASRTGC